MIVKRIRYTLNKCLHFFLALQILNLSFGNLAMEENIFAATSYGSNQIDSAFEYITEYVLGWNDFVPEQHKARQDAHFLKVNTCYFYCERLNISEETISYQTNPVHGLYIPGSLSEYDQEINPPPPKQIIALQMFS